MGQDKCAYCNCQTFDKNPFSPGKCATCLHNHVKPAGSSSPAGSPALKSVSTPNNITKPQNNNNSNSQLKNNTTVPPTTPAKKKPPPVPASVSSPNLKDDKAPSAPPKPQRFASTDNYKVNSGPTNNNNNNTNNNNPAVPAKPNKTTGPPVPSNRPTGPKVNTTISNSGNAPNSPSLNSISTPASPSVRGAMSSEKKKESFFSSFKKFITGDDEENAPAVLEIGSPVFVKHTTHIGITDKGFETRNLPPDMKKIFEDLDKTLKSMGAKKLTKKEAQFVLNTLLAAMPPNGKISSYYTKGRAGSTTTKPANMPAAVAPGTPQQKPAPAPSIAERTQAYNNAAKTTPATSVTSPTLQSTTNYSANPPRPRIEKPLPSVAQAENKELAKLREQVKNLELEVNRYKDQVNTQRSQLKGLESDRIAASKASDLASDQQKRLERLEKENKELQDNIRQTQDAARGESKGKNDMEKQIILLQNEVREAQNKGKTAETNIINEEKKRKAVEDELNKTKDRLEALKGVEEARTKLEHEIERLKLQQAQQGANSSSISEKLTASFEQEIKELKALAAKDLDEATKKYKDIDAEVKKLSQQVQDKNKEKNEFETTISNLKAEKAVSAKDASAAIEEINRLKSQLDQIKNETGKRAAEEKTIQELRDKNRDLEYTKKELESKAQFFENERSDFERERNAWANERKDKDTERREIEGERRERDAEREEWERERESYEEERRKWEIEKRNILNEVEKARSSAGSSAEVTSPPSSIPASIPAPPPPPPPMMPSFDKKPLSISSSPKISQPPAAPDNRDALLEAIRNPGKQLKHRESLIVPKDIDLSTQDPTNIVGILARALIDRRADIGEEEDEEDNESWDE